MPLGPRLSGRRVWGALRVLERNDLVWKVGTKPVYELKFASGRKIRATGKHRLYCSFGWQQVSDLRPGDRLAVARGMPEAKDPERWPDDRIALLAHMIGDGSYLMLNSEIATSVALKRKLIIVLLDNGGFGCIHRLQSSTVGVEFSHSGQSLPYSGNTRITRRSGSSRFGECGADTSRP